MLYFKYIHVLLFKKILLDKGLFLIIKTITLLYIIFIKNYQKNDIHREK